MNLIQLKLNIKFIEKTDHSYYFHLFEKNVVKDW